MEQSSDFLILNCYFDYENGIYRNFQNFEESMRSMRTNQREISTRSELFTTNTVKFRNKSHEGEKMIAIKRLSLFGGVHQ